MSLYHRLRYSLHLAAVGGSLLGLIIVLASADVVGLLPRSAFDFLMSPGYLLIVFVVAFFSTPIVAPHFPIAWESTTSDQENKTKTRNSHAVRLIALTGIGLLLAVLGNFLVYLLH